MLRLTEGRFLSLYTGPWFHKKVDSSLHDKGGKNLSLRGDKCTEEEEDMNKQRCGSMERGLEQRRPPTPQPRVPEREMKWDT